MHSNKTKQSSFRRCDFISHSSFDRVCVVAAVAVVVGKPVFACIYRRIYVNRVMCGTKESFNSACQLSNIEANTTTSCISLQF